MFPVSTPGGAAKHLPRSKVFGWTVPCDSIMRVRGDRPADQTRNRNHLQSNVLQSEVLVLAVRFAALDAGTQWAVRMVPAASRTSPEIPEPANELG